MPTLGPVLMQNETTGLGVIERVNAEKVLHLAFEATGGERHRRERGNLRASRVETNNQLYSFVWGTLDEHVDDSKRRDVIVSGYRGDPKAVGQQLARPKEQFVSRHVK
jgi:hypothetical protein